MAGSNRRGTERECPEGSTRGAEGFALGNNDPGPGLARLQSLVCVGNPGFEPRSSGRPQRCFKPGEERQLGDLIRFAFD
jgi:hypothetical protein